MSWLCPYQLGELCKRVKKTCEPGMKCCVLHGRVKIIEHKKKGDGNNMKDKIEKALGTIRPALQADGGDIQLVSVEDGTVKVRLTGACGGCPMSQMTMTQGVEQAIKKAVPQIKKVIAV